MTEASYIICSAIFLHILLPSFRLCTSTKVISSISSYHQLFNWSITPPPLLLNASLINYCPPQVFKWEGCQAEFSRLKRNFYCLCSLEFQSTQTCFGTCREDDGFKSWTDFLSGLHTGTSHILKWQSKLNIHTFTTNQRATFGVRGTVKQTYWPSTAWRWWKACLERSLFQ